MKVKIQNKKVLYRGGRIICNGCRLTVEELIKMVEHYLYTINKLKEIRNVSIDQEKLNAGIHFNMFNIDCTVGKLFELYNEIARLENLTVYSKLWYNPVQSSKFSPSKVG